MTITEHRPRFLVDSTRGRVHDKKHNNWNAKREMDMDKKQSLIRTLTSLMIDSDEIEEWIMLDGEYDAK